MTIKRPPMTHEEMRAMYRDGDPVSLIMQRGRVRNGLSKAEVRKIIYQE